MNETEDLLANAAKNDRGVGMVVSLRKRWRLRGRRGVGRRRRAGQRAFGTFAPGSLLVLAAAGLVACSTLHADDADYEVSVDLGPAIRSLGSDDLEVSEPAADRIVALGSDATPALVTALRREPPTVRLGVVLVLGRLDDPAAQAALVDVAGRDGDIEVRGMAIRSLGAGAGPEARSIVETALSDPAASIRLAAAGACATLCVSSAALESLATVAIGDQSLANSIVARAAFLRILASNDRGRVERARAAILSTAPAALSGDTALRAAILASDVGDSSGRGILAGAVRGDAPPMLRLQAVHALGAVGTEAEIPTLAALEGQPTLGEYAYDALRRLSGRGVTGAQTALDDWRGPAPRVELPPPGTR